MGNKMTSIEKEQWDRLYQYVKKEILMYDDSQSIPPNLVLRLKGLTTGVLIYNKREKEKANYTYDTVLYTFQICKPKIMEVLSRKTFENERQKFNYICRIVENNLNDVYLRLKKINKSDDEIQSVDTSIISHDGGKYQKKTEEMKNKRLDDLW